MTGTFTLPDGTKVRVGSHRRFIVVGRPFPDGKARVVARSDKLLTARGRMKFGETLLDTEGRKVWDRPTNTWVALG